MVLVFDTQNLSRDGVWLVQALRTHPRKRPESPKCTRAVSTELTLPEGDTNLNLTGVFVEGTDAERTVEGRWVHPTKGEGPFTCVVVPDANDKLRGLRVIRIEVQAATPR